MSSPDIWKYWKLRHLLIKILPIELSTQALKLKQPHHNKCVCRSLRNQVNAYLIAWSHKGENLKKHIRYPNSHLQHTSECCLIQTLPHISTPCFMNFWHHFHQATYWIGSNVKLTACPVLFPPFSGDGFLLTALISKVYISGFTIKSWFYTAKQSYFTNYWDKVPKEIF